MKKVFATIAILIFLSTIVNALEEYKTLNPTINRISTEKSEAKYILFFSGDGTIAGKEETILLVSLDSREELTLTNTIMDLNIKDIQTSFWDVNGRDNYCYLLKQGTRAIDEGNGWHKFQFDTKTFHFSLFDLKNSLFQRRKCPPNVFISDTNENLNIDFNYNLEEDRLFEQKVIIADKESHEIDWSFYIETENRLHPFNNIFWINEGWLFIENSFLTSLYENNEANYLLFNYRTNSIKTLYPDKIIGYGQGYIITTTPDFYGITIQNPEGYILFKDESYDLVGRVRETEFMPDPLIYIAYYDSSYVFYTVYNRFSVGAPYCSVILDLKTMQSFVTTDENASILGIF